MRTLKLTLEYDGTRYSGWQSQKNGVAIQDVVTAAVAKMTEEKIVLRGASRTDAGVHALGQVASFQTGRGIPCDGFLRGINSLLPEDIRVVVCEEVPPNFHPVDSARRKIYEYRLQMGNVPSALQRHRVWWVGPHLDSAAMQHAAECLIGEHDFKSFQGANADTKTTVRRLESIGIQPGGENILALQFTANGFLKYMVRNIVGTLVEVGLGKMPPQRVKEILAARDRRLAGPTAPPQGLYLVKVD